MAIRRESGWDCWWTERQRKDKKGEWRITVTFFGWATRWILRPKIILNHISILLKLTSSLEKYSFRFININLIFVSFSNFLFWKLSSLWKYYKGSTVNTYRFLYLYSPVSIFCYIYLHHFLSLYTPTHTVLLKHLKESSRHDISPLDYSAHIFKEQGHSPVELFYFHYQEFLL